MIIQYEMKDYLRANQLHLIQTTSTTEFLIVNLLMLANGLGLGVLYLLSHYWLLLILVIFFGFVSLINLLNVFILLPGRARRIFEQQKEFQIPTEIELLEDGLRESSTNSELFVPWGDFYEWREDSEYLVLYLSTMVFIIFPKRLVEDPAVLDQIKQSLAENGVGQNKRNKKNMKKQYAINAVIMGALLIFISIAVVYFVITAIFF